MGTLAAAKIPVEFLGAKRDRGTIREASQAWLKKFSDNPLERGTGSAAGADGEENGEAGDIVDPDLAGFWVEDEEEGGGLEGGGHGKAVETADDGAVGGLSENEDDEEGVGEEVEEEEGEDEEADDLVRRSLVLMRVAAIICIHPLRRGTRTTLQKSLPNLRRTKPRRRHLKRRFGRRNHSSSIF